MIFLLKVAAPLSILILGIYMGIRAYINQDSDKEPVQKKKMPSWALPGMLILISILLFIVFSPATAVPPTSVAVVENSWSGEFFTLEPGTHIWPFSRQIPPLLSKITLYSLRRQQIEIGGEPVQQNGVSADSNSPGRPVVSFYGRGWAYPEKSKIIELHRKYGASYLDDWVERNWISVLKATQGDRPYDYVGNHRLEMQDAVEKSLQKQLLADDEDPLVIISQLSIVDFDYDSKITAYLDTVAQKEFERQGAEQQIEINKKQQDAAKIQVETDFITKKRAAESEQIRLITEAQGQADSKKLIADADAYGTKVKYEAESNGIKQVNDALAKSSPLYIQYLWVNHWEGYYPGVLSVGDEDNPLKVIQVPMPKQEQP